MDNRLPIRTIRLLLRPYRLSDADDLKRLAGDYDVARGTLLMPHPYEEGMAEEFIRRQEKAISEGEAFNFGIFSHGTEEFVGGIGIRVFKHHNTAELGYWIGKPYWGKGYATEAVAAVVEFGLADLGLRKIFAEHFKSNPASGRVLEKTGFLHEGCRRRHVLRFGTIQDVELYGQIKDEQQRP